MKYLSVFIVALYFFNAHPSFAQDSWPVCGRSDAVKAELEILLKKSCESITDEDLAKVTYLNLSNKGMERLVYWDLGGLTALFELKLDNNRLVIIDMRAFHTVPNLTYLTLDHNKINYLPSDAFARVPNLSGLTLNHNEFSSISEDLFSGLTELRILDLSDNKLTKFYPSQFSDLKSIWAIHLNGNNISQKEQTRLIDLGLPVTF